MDKSLIIAEKPSVAMNYAEALGSFSRKDGFLENGEFIITWALGHLVEIQGIGVPEKWNYADLPLLVDFRLMAAHNPGKSKQLNVIRSLAQRRDIKEVIIGTDAGREGELIARYILSYTNNSKPVKRLWISSQTPAAVLEGMNNLKPAVIYDHLYAAARCRNMADWYVGINATRAYTTRLHTNELFSVGRVQTPTLSLIVSREREIENFKPEPYYVLSANTESGKGSFIAKYAGEQIREKSELLKIIREVEGGKGKVTLFENRQIKQNPPLPPDLTELQKQCNTRFGWTAAQTLLLAQELYEKRFISYPRTNSRYLSSDLQPTFMSRLQAIKHMERYGPFADRIKSARPAIKAIDDSKIDDHYAIIPLDTVADKLSGDLLTLYELIAAYFLAIFYPPAVFRERRIEYEINGHKFKALSKFAEQPGYREIPGIVSRTEDPEEEEAEQSLPELKEGDDVKISDLEFSEKSTQAPKRYTEATILHAMKTASKKSGIDVPGDWGLGTAATRAAILETLKKRGYITAKGKALMPTAKGKRIIDILKTEGLKSADLTAAWEDKLIGVEKGEVGFNQFIEEIKDYVTAIVADAGIVTIDNIPEEKKELGKCPLCGASVTETKKAYSCSAWKEGCKFVIWKEIAGKSISEAQAKKILAKGRSDKIKGFKAKRGGNFEAFLALNQDMKIVFEFED
jgi:DNA topoisomerase-3